MIFEPLPNITLIQKSKLTIDLNKHVHGLYHEAPNIKIPLLQDALSKINPSLKGYRIKPYADVDIQSFFDDLIELNKNRPIYIVCDDANMQSTMCNRIFNENIQQVTHFVTTHDIHLFYFIQH